MFPLLIAANHLRKRRSNWTFSEVQYNDNDNDNDDYRSGDNNNNIIISDDVFCLNYESSAFLVVFGRCCNQPVRYDDIDDDCGDDDDDGYDDDDIDE